MLCDGDLLKSRIFGLNYVLRGCERFLDRIVLEDLMSSSEITLGNNSPPTQMPHLVSPPESGRVGRHATPLT